MSVYGLLLVRDEADIIEETVSHMLTQVDHIIAMDNGSVDGTRAILDRLGVEVIDDAERAHYQSRKTSWMARQAAARGADWVIPFDADEVWRSPHGRIADVLADCPHAVAAARLYNHCATGTDDMALPPVRRMGWRTRDPLGLPKVACRPALSVTIAEGNHCASYAEGVVHDLLEVRHYPYRSPEQFLSKVRNGAEALRATSLPASVGEHWRMYGDLLDREGPDAVMAWFREHFWTTDPSAWPDMVYDPAPACRLPS